jgi:hypothetical protein
MFSDMSLGQLYFGHFRARTPYLSFRPVGCSPVSRGFDNSHPRTSMIIRPSEVVLKGSTS